MAFYIYEKEDVGDYWKFSLIKKIQGIPRLFIQPIFSSIRDDYNEKYFKWKTDEVNIRKRILEIYKNLAAT
ncbi:hypothetical protein KJ656_00515, partial [bacterium]|nr:hypothetical protein [bacterium]